MAPRKKARKHHKKPQRQTTIDAGPTTTPSPNNPTFARYVPGRPWEDQECIKGLWRKTGGPGEKTQYGEFFMLTPSMIADHRLPLFMPAVWEYSWLGLTVRP